MEIRYFLKKINKRIASPLISDELWEEAKQQTITKYKDSSCLDYIKNFFSAFEKTNKAKYHSDLNEFLFESKLEDFCGDGVATIFVSTIHKAKGREFDTVYMMLNNQDADKEDDIRKLYVGITRAKQDLYIHCNTPIFHNNEKQNIHYQYDMSIYPEPEEIALQLSMRDVNLGFFKDKKETILKLVSGTSLNYNNGFLQTSSGENVVYLSKAKREELKDWYEKGYLVKSAIISCILAWKGKDDEEECAVILPDLVLQKQKK